jgi:hypothetical protein
VIVLCEIESPNVTVGGGDLGVGEAPIDPTMPEELQSSAQSYSPSIRFPRMSTKLMKFVRELQLGPQTGSEAL